jgi:hypothetical protein
MFVVQDIMFPTVYTHVDSTQKIAIYHNNKDGKYTTRFYVDNYQPKDKRHPQRSFGKSFKTMGESLDFGEKICSRLSKFDANDERVLKRIYKETK